MGIVVVKEGDHWYIVKNPHTVAGEGIGHGRSRSPRARTTYGGFWTGTCWSGQRSNGMKFNTQDEGDAYAKEHFAEIADAE
jgi:hypothetical protein